MPDRPQLAPLRACRPDLRCCAPYAPDRGRSGPRDPDRAASTGNRRSMRPPHATPAQDRRHDGRRRRDGLRTACFPAAPRSDDTCPGNKCEQAVRPGKGKRQARDAGPGACSPPPPGTTSDGTGRRHAPAPVRTRAPRAHRSRPGDDDPGRPEPVRTAAEPGPRSHSPDACADPRLPAPGTAPAAHPHDDRPVSPRSRCDVPAPRGSRWLPRSPGGVARDRPGRPHQDGHGRRDVSRDRPGAGAARAERRRAAFRHAPPLGAAARRPTPPAVGSGRGHAGRAGGR
jgi:hypothetical protein